MGFMLGFLLGLLTAIGLFGFAAYWMCSRLNHIALARFINGIAQALASLRQKSPERPPTTANGEAKENALAGSEAKPRRREGT